FATETGMVMALVKNQTRPTGNAVSSALSTEIDLLARISRQLDAEVERLHGQPDLAVNQLNERVRGLLEHAGNLQKQLDDTRRTSDQHIVNLKDGLRLTQNHGNNLEK